MARSTLCRCGTGRAVILGVAPVLATATSRGGARHTTVFSNGDRADPVSFMTAGGLRLAWRTETVPYLNGHHSSGISSEAATRPCSPAATRTRGGGRR